MLRALLLTFWLGLLVGCQTGGRPGFAGAYRFPDDIDLHNPVLILTKTNTFAFTGEAGADWANHGTVARRHNNTLLLLRYEETECCQFEGVEEESLVILESRANRLRVRFRDAVYWLERLPE
jgi:hypothetical protein